MRAWMTVTARSQHLAAAPSFVFRHEETTLSSTRENYEKLRAFIEGSLQTFIDIERENADYRHTIRVLQNQEAATRSQRRLVTWIAHGDEGFIEGMRQIAERVHIDLQVVVYTGGEVLDYLSRSEPDLLIIGDNFPDIPAEFVLDSVRSQAQRCAILRIDGWSSNERAAQLSGPYDEATIGRDLSTARDLVALLDEARLRFEGLEKSSNFARSFRERHSNWLRGYKEATDIIDDILDH